jgi:nucleotide-binding universal stress UspA family protein
MSRICNRILVATDFSNGADAALAYATSLAGALQSTIHLVHVLEDPLVPASVGASDGFTPMPVEMPEEVRQRAEEALRARMGNAVGGTEVLTGPMTATAIVAVARERGADLIVMGTHGRRGLAHLLLGSVAEQVVRTADCPVLTVRHAPAAVSIPAMAGSVLVPAV